jgi:deoxycytidylate deaminase
MSEKVSVEELTKCLQESWSKETSADPENWSPDNPAWGQCAVTTLVAQDFLGGAITRLDLSHAPHPKIAAMRSHYFNNIDGHDRDFSASQFPDGKNYYRDLLTAENVSQKSRGYLFANEETKRRYKRLRLSVAKKLSGNNPLFDDAIFHRCLELALDSDCQKGKYGCVAIYRGKTIAEAFNKILEPLRDCCSPECIRKSIPSRTESMIGACGHAEELALAAVRDLGVTIGKVKFFVAGFRSNGLAYIKPEADSTCIRCGVQFYINGVEKTYVPVRTKWQVVSKEAILRSAKDFALQTKTLENFEAR